MVLFSYSRHASILYGDKKKERRQRLVRALLVVPVSLSVFPGRNQTNAIDHHPREREREGGDGPEEEAQKASLASNI